MKEAVYEVVWPRGRRVAENIPFAHRLDSLEGKTIGFLWDWIFRGDEIYPMMAKELSRRYPGMKFVGQDVFKNIHGGNEARNVAALPQRLKENGVDAVISGIGC